MEILEEGTTFTAHWSLRTCIHYDPEDEGCIMLVLSQNPLSVMWGWIKFTLSFICYHYVWLWHIASSGRQNLGVLTWYFSDPSECILECLHVSLSLDSHAIRFLGCGAILKLRRVKLVVSYISRGVESDCIYLCFISHVDFLIQSGGTHKCSSPNLFWSEALRPPLSVAGLSWHQDYSPPQISPAIKFTALCGT